jgi:Ca-activated chloride channel family protein
MYTLGHPSLLWLILLPLVLRLFLPPYREPRQAVRTPWFQRTAKLTGAKPGEGAVVAKTGWLRLVFQLLMWSLVVLALARPQFLEDPIQKIIPTRDLLLLVDLSGSMEAEDFTNREGETVDRLTAVQEVLDEFLTRREGDRVGLVVFGNAPFVQVPFTQDLDACRMLLEETAVRMAGPRTAFGDAIGLGITLFEESEVEDRVMIALTDGNDTGSQVPPAKAAGIAATRGVVIHTVAIGDPTSVGEEALDEEALEAIAETSGGQYFFAADRDSLEGIYETLDRLETRKVETISHRPRR